MRRLVTEPEDLYLLLDSLLREPKLFWNGFYSDRKKDIPFFSNVPDENLVDYIDCGLFKPGRVLELGCGPGRNAIYLAKKGYVVDAVDLSRETINWAIERAKIEQVDINFNCQNIFELNFQEGSYDIVYDSGCFHHIAPHRRISYIQLVKKALKTGGYFAVELSIEMKELLPHASLHIFEQSNHYPYLEEKELFIQTINEVL